MLRAGLGARLAAHAPAPPEGVVVAAAAVEMVQAASLIHDDVVDGAEIRRGAPAFWRRYGASGAILTGDLLFCSALELLGSAEGRFGLVLRFAEKVREMCEAETEQKILLKGHRVSRDRCMDIARRKTGPLFAFIAGVCGEGDRDLSAALEEAGYRIGTAYQIADDLLDAVGNEDLAGKTLGTDVKRQKYTLPVLTDDGEGVSAELVSDLLGAAGNRLGEWPWARNAVTDFVSCDLVPVIRAQLQSPHLDMSHMP